MSESVASTQVLTFRLGDRSYCVDIVHVDEIVDRKELTPLPESAPHVEGVMDLRGTTTTIINPKKVLDIDDDGIGDRIIVFDDETGEGSTGWVIDTVDEVTKVNEAELDDSVESDSVRGILRDDDGFVVWVKPDVING